MLQKLIQMFVKNMAKILLYVRDTFQTMYKIQVKLLESLSFVSSVWNDNENMISVSIYSILIQT